MLEESAPSRAHFAWLLAYAATTLLCLSPLLSVPFLGSTLSSTLVYIWARRHPDVQLSFLGIFVFTAPWLPWVMIGLSVLLHSQWPKDELFGIIVGHGKPAPQYSTRAFCVCQRKNAPVADSKESTVWYFFNDIYPDTHNNSRPMDPPNWWRRLFEGRDFNATPAEIDRNIPPAAAAARAVPEVR